METLNLAEGAIILILVCVIFFLLGIYYFQIKNKFQNRVFELEKENLGLKDAKSALEGEVNNLKAIINQKDTLIRQLEINEDILKNKFKKRVSELEEENLGLKDAKSALDEEVNNLKAIINQKDTLIREFEIKEDILKNIFRSEVIKEEDDERFSEIERFLFKEMIPQIDRMNVFENEYEIFEEIKAEFEKYKILFIKPWEQKYTNFAFVGKFSTGKSSLINSLLEEKVLPVDLSPSTAVPTFIMYGIEKDIFFEDFKDSIRKLDASYFSKITEERLKHVPLSDLIKYFIVYKEKEFLKDYIIMDTPGIFLDHDNIEETRKKLHTWISEAENIFWVIDITEGCIDRNSLSILSELSNKKIFLIINKADAVSPSNRKKVVAGIKDSCNKEKINISDIILYSSKEDIDGCRENVLNVIKINNSKAENDTFYKYMRKFFKNVIKKTKTEYQNLINSGDRNAIYEAEKKWKNIEKLEKKFKEMILNI